MMCSVLKSDMKMKAICADSLIVSQHAPAACDFVKMHMQVKSQLKLLSRAQIKGPLN